MPTRLPLFLLIFLLPLALGLPACKGKKKAQSAYIPPTDTVSVNKPGVRNDVRVVLHQETLNKVFKALGNISATEEYSVAFVHGHYTWTLINPRIRLKPGKADFVADVNVKAGSFDYTSMLAGDVKIWYDLKKNLINIKITKAIFEVYTRVLGKKVHITEIDLASQFPDPFTFEGPTTMETDMDFSMPDNSVVKLYMRTTDCDVIVEDRQLCVPCEVEFYKKGDPKAPQGK